MLLLELFKYIWDGLFGFPKESFCEQFLKKKMFLSVNNIVISQRTLFHYTFCVLEKLHKKMSQITFILRGY